MPYTPTWNNPYTTTNPYQTQQVTPTVQYPMPYQQQPFNGIEKVSSKDSLYQLPMQPNSMSKAYFDVNGKYFYIVSTDAAGAKTIETFDFFPHKEEEPVRIDGAQFVSRQEYDQFVAKVGAALEALNGIHATVPATATGTIVSDSPSGIQGEHGEAKADNAGRPVSVV